ncbi:MAG: EamA family transporter [Rhodococcus sp.]|uniref:EamA family transporter n=1 Tax=Rhodococcus sp. TaxID=1831 RepID=UPI001694D46C|nr:EamA family transporter [Rhodococcus sp. (in: high G+C Gram-positive bacteria)]NLV81026.1 EamA family transporter [Rhodococcus sp. (in: high G+C Gram-positive bacteria)]
MKSPTFAPQPNARWAIVSSTAFAPAVWGTTYVVTTLFLPDDHALWSGALRALPAGLLLLSLGRTLPTGGWWWKALALGILNIGAFFPLLFVAAYLLPGGIAAVFSAAGPLVIAALALPLLSERPTTGRLLWGVLAVVGVAMMVLAPGVRLNLVGVLAGIAAPLSMAVGTVLSKRWGRPVGPVAYAGWQLTAGGLVIVPPALLFEGGPPALDGPALAGYAWLGIIGAALAYTLWFRGVGNMPAGAVAFLPLISPLVAAVLGWAVLGEALTPFQGTGFALALLAVACAQRTPARLSPPLDQPPSPHDPALDTETALPKKKEHTA